MAELPRQVGFPDGQFLANGIEEQASLDLAECWKTSDHDKAEEIINKLPENIQPVAERIYSRCKSIQPRGGMRE